MRVIDSYIIRHLVTIGLFVTAALTAAVWLSQSLRFMD
jgi:lipopolysaccharide export LptBFGC system permease protein LptF